MLEVVIVLGCLIILGVAAWACRQVQRDPSIIQPPKTRRCWICGDTCIDLDKDGKS
jgi:hypothetical protein